MSETSVHATTCGYDNFVWLELIEVERISPNGDVLHEEAFWNSFGNEPARFEKELRGEYIFGFGLLLEEATP